MGVTLLTGNGIRSTIVDNNSMLDMQLLQDKFRLLLKKAPMKSIEVGKPDWGYSIEKV